MAFTRIRETIRAFQKEPPSRQRRTTAPPIGRGTRFFSIDALEWMGLLDEVPESAAPNPIAGLLARTAALVFTFLSVVYCLRGLFRPLSSLWGLTEGLILMVAALVIVYAVSLAAPWKRMKAKGERARVARPRARARTRAAGPIGLEPSRYFGAKLSETIASLIGRQSSQEG